MLARAGKLFYVHLNDNDRNWDWDMLPGAFHFWEFLEFFYFLKLARSGNHARIGVVTHGADIMGRFN